MSVDNGETMFHLGPGAFPEVNSERIATLLNTPLLQLKTLTHAITDIESGADVELPEELRGQQGIDLLHLGFIQLLDQIKDEDGRLKEATTGLGSTERFTDRSVTAKLHTAITEKLIAEGWASDEIICADLIGCGFFGLDDLVS